MRLCCTYCCCARIGSVTVGEFGVWGDLSVVGIVSPRAHNAHMLGKILEDVHNGHMVQTHQPLAIHLISNKRVGMLG